MNKKFNPYDFAQHQASKAPSADRIENEIVHIEESEEEQYADEPLKAQGWQEDQDGQDGQDEQENLSEEELEKLRAKRERQKARESKFFWQFISGGWLILDGITGAYRYLLLVAAALFLSVVSIFWTFHLGAKYAQRESSVQLLHERSLEYQRERFNKTSHSAIVKELKRRNIPLYDLQESKTIVE